MALKLLIVKIPRSELHTVVEKVLPWELPILEALHNSVEVVGEDSVDRDPPEVNDEFVRLENRYRKATNEDGSQGLPLVASVYGQFALGIANLKRAIDGAVLSGDVSDLV